MVSSLQQAQIINMFCMSCIFIEHVLWLEDDQNVVFVFKGLTVSVIREENQQKGDLWVCIKQFTSQSIKIWAMVCSGRGKPNSGWDLRRQWSQNQLETVENHSGCKHRTGVSKGEDHRSRKSWRTGKARPRWAFKGCYWKIQIACRAIEDLSARRQFAMISS